MEGTLATPDETKSLEGYSTDDTCATGCLQLYQCQNNILCGVSTLYTLEALELTRHLLHVPV